MKTATYVLVLCAVFCASVLAGIVSSRERDTPVAPSVAAVQTAPDLPAASAFSESVPPVIDGAVPAATVAEPAGRAFVLPSVEADVPADEEVDAFVLEGELNVGGDEWEDVEILEPQRRTAYLGRGPIAAAIVAYNQWRPTTRLVWPAYGPVTSHYRLAHPLGIDIGQAEGPVVAATGGTVTFAGGDPCCSYGLHVIIVSGTGITTVYGHLESLRVQTGDDVQQGQVLGLIGCTGRCSGPHLHFEVLRNGRRQNPLLFLP